MIERLSYGVTIAGHPYLLYRVLQPLCVSGAFPFADPANPTFGTLTDALQATGAGLGLSDAGAFQNAVYADITSLAAGPLAGLLALLQGAPTKLTGLGIDTEAGLYRVGFCCDVSAAGLKPYGIPLAAFGLNVAYHPAGAASGKRPPPKRKRGA